MNSEWIVFTFIGGNHNIYYISDVNNLNIHNCCHGGNLSAATWSCNIGSVNNLTVIHHGAGGLEQDGTKTVQNMWNITNNHTENNQRYNTYNQTEHNQHYTTYNQTQNNQRYITNNQTQNNQWYTTYNQTQNNPRNITYNQASYNTAARSNDPLRDVNLPATNHPATGPQSTETAPNNCPAQPGTGHGGATPVNVPKANESGFLGFLGIDWGRLFSNKNPWED